MEPLGVSKYHMHITITWFKRKMRNISSDSQPMNKEDYYLNDGVKVDPQGAGFW